MSGSATSRYSLGALAPTRQERANSYQLAFKAFSDILEREVPTEASANLEDEHFERVLMLHMAAFVTLKAKGQVRGENAILDEMLRHERHYWQQRSSREKLPRTLVTEIRRAMAAFTLRGGVGGESEALEVLRRLHTFMNYTDDVLLEVARLLHDCYPGEKWIAPLRPSLLGDYLVQREMEHGADELLDLVLGPRRA